MLSRKFQIESIINALSRELKTDYRDEKDIKPIFKQSLQKITDLKEGDIVSGVVTNMTTFGYFVDIGVGQDGLIHKSKLNGHLPNIGDRVNAMVINLDVNKNRIGLNLKDIL